MKRLTTNCLFVILAIGGVRFQNEGQSHNVRAMTLTMFVMAILVQTV